MARRDVRSNLKLALRYPQKVLESMWNFRYSLEGAILFGLFYYLAQIPDSLDKPRTIPPISQFPMLEQSRVDCSFCGHDCPELKKILPYRSHLNIFPAYSFRRGLPFIPSSGYPVHIGYLSHTPLSLEALGMVFFF